MKKRIISIMLLAVMILTAIPFSASAAPAYWGFDDYETIEQPGAPAEITSYPTTVKKVNDSTYTMTSDLGGGRTISISLIKEPWGTFNLGNWILKDGNKSHNFTGASTDMEYVHLSQVHSGGICYTGGNHGNEAFISIEFYNAETGAKLDFSANTSYNTNGVHVIEKTKLLRFNDGNSDSIGDYDGSIIKPGNYTDNDVNAEITRKYTFAGAQIKLNVDYKFVRDTRQWRSYNCMFPIDKKYSLYCDMIDKNGAIIKTITSRPYGDTSIANYAGPQNEGNDATRAVIYSADYPNYQFDIRVNTYKDSLNEHKNATYKTSYWDMNSTHNKLYFTKYGDGGSMEVTQKAGTEYHTECIWLFNYVESGRQPSEGEIPVSRGKTYTNDVNTGGAEWNTSYGAKLTDGVAAEKFGQNDDSWYLFSMYSTNVVNAIGTTVIDLGADYDISKVRLHLANVSSMSVGAPSSIKVYGSTDNQNFNQFATVPTQSSADAIYWTSVDAPDNTIARYVKFEFVVPSGLAFVNEIEVYGDIPVEAEDPNLASGREYNISVTNEPVVDSQWNVDYSANLTDGKAHKDYAFNGGHWFMFSSSKNVIGGKGTVTIDFDKICNITKFKLHLINNIGSNVKPPKEINVYVSTNGKDYTLAGQMPVDTTASVGYWSELKVDNVKAGSVRFEIVLDGGYAPLNEIEIRGTETAQDYVPETDDEENNDDSSDVVDDSSDVVDDSSDVVDDSSDVVDDSSDVVDDSSDVVDDSSDVVDDSSDVVDDSSDVVDDSSDVVDDSSDVVDDSSDVVDDSSDVVDDSSDDTSSDDESSDVIEEENEIGDINGNDKIDMTDYILLKRAYFGTYNFNENQNKAGDINQNGKIDMTDYILLKRIYFGTYTLKK